MYAQSVFFSNEDTNVSGLGIFNALLNIQRRIVGGPVTLHIVEACLLKESCDDALETASIKCKEHWAHFKASDTICCRLSICAPQIHVLQPNPSEMALGGGASGRWLGHEHATLMNVIDVLIQETPGTALWLLPPGGGTARRRRMRKWSVTEHRICGSHDLGLPSLQNRKK